MAQGKVSSTGSTVNNKKSTPQVTKVVELQVQDGRLVVDDQDANPGVIV